MVKIWQNYNHFNVQCWATIISSSISSLSCLEPFQSSNTNYSKILGKIIYCNTLTQEKESIIWKCKQLHSCSSGSFVSILLSLYKDPGSNITRLLWLFGINIVIRVWVRFQHFGMRSFCNSKWMQGDSKSVWNTWHITSEFFMRCLEPKYLWVSWRFALFKYLNNK